MGGFSVTTLDVVSLLAKETRYLNESRFIGNSAVLLSAYTSLFLHKADWMYSGKIAAFHVGD